MNGEIIISDENMGNDIFFDTILNRFSIEVYLPKNKTLESFLNDKNQLFSTFNNIIKEEKNMGFSDSEDIQAMEMIRDNVDHLLDYVDYIKLYCTRSTLKEIIERNPILLTKKLVIVNLFKISDYEKLKKIADNNKDIVDKLYISLEGNDNYIPINDAVKTIEEIHSQVGFIKQMNFSQLETIMFVYDYVRKRIYKYEEDNEDYRESRDLTNVLFGNKIVCLGYTNLFNSILSYLGIKSEPALYESAKYEKAGHARTLIKVDDKKYNIKGLFLFDPTWDSRTSDNNNNYLRSYKYFAKSNSFMSKYDKKANLLPNRFFRYYDEKNYQLLRTALKNHDREQIEMYVSTLNHLARRIIGSDLISPVYAFVSEVSPKVQDDILQKYKYICAYISQSISAEKMIILANNVRKVEYYFDHSYFPYSTDDLCIIMQNSKWVFKHTHLTPNERLLAAILGEIDTEDRSEIDDFIGYIKEKNIENDIQHIRLTKTLRLVLDKKRENQ